MLYHRLCRISGIPIRASSRFSIWKTSSWNSGVDSRLGGNTGPARINFSNFLWLASSNGNFPITCTPYASPSSANLASYLPLLPPKNTPKLYKSNNRAVARKPRDAAAVLFGLKYVDNIHYKFKSSQVSKARLQSSKHTGAKQNLTQNGHSRSFKVTCFGVNGKTIRY